MLLDPDPPDSHPSKSRGGGVTIPLEKERGGGKKS